MSPASLSSGWTARLLHFQPRHCLGSGAVFYDAFCIIQLVRPQGFLTVCRGGDTLDPIMAILMGGRKARTVYFVANGTQEREWRQPGGLWELQALPQVPSRMQTFLPSRTCL